MLKYRNSTLVIERRYNAQTIIDYLLLKLPEAGEDPFKRMFNQVVQKREERAKDFDRVMAGASIAPATCTTSTAATSAS